MELPSTGPPLGLFAETTFASSPLITLEPGDVVLLATDGIAETVASDNRQFEAAGVLASLRARLDRPASEIVAGLCQDARAFAGDHRQIDDMAAIVIKFDP